MSEKGLITKLAVDRTKLANERTFLAYLRTFIVFLGSGIAVLKVDEFQNLSTLGITLTSIAPLVLIMGITRFLIVRRRIRRYCASEKL